MELRSPNFGNVVTLDTGVINARTQDGELVQIYHDEWGHEDSFNVDFSGLSEVEKWALVDFYQNNIGQQIVFKDHENRQWLGFLTTKITFRQTGPGCQYTANFGFLGTLI